MSLISWLWNSLAAGWHKRGGFAALHHGDMDQSDYHFARQREHERRMK